MSPIVTGLIGGAVATIICLLAERNHKFSRTDTNDWKRLRPGWIIHSILVGCAFFVSLAGFILLTGGSSRPDADEQNFSLILLLAGFASGGIAVGWATYGKVVMWKNDQLSVQKRFGGRSIFARSDILSIRKSEISDMYRLTFNNGSKLDISVYMCGSQELISEMQGMTIKPN